MKNRVFAMTSLAAVLGLLTAVPVLATDEPVTDESTVSDETVKQSRDDKGGWHHKHSERWDSMSEEEREAFRAKRQEFREKMSAMTPEEREAYLEERMQERLANMTPEQRARFDKRMQRFDTDGDGKISDEERQAARETWKAKRLEKYDTDGDGQISDEERMAAREAWKAKRLEKYDTDGDGQISDEEREAAKKARQQRWQKHSDDVESDSDRS